MILAIISDIHGNSEALRAVLAHLEAHAADRVYSLGDLVGYGPDPNGVIDLIRERGITSVLGNYDDGVGFERGNCGCYYPTPEARAIGAASYAFTVGAVSEDRKAYLRSLPGEIRLEIEGHRLRLVHGSPRRINEYLLKDRAERTFLRIAAAAEADVLLFGHTHAAWHRTYGSVLFVNVGSVGRPKDGDPRAAYTRLSLSPQQIDVEHVRVPYDVAATVRRIRAVGLPGRLAEELAAGQTS